MGQEDLFIKTNCPRQAVLSDRYAAVRQAYDAMQALYSAYNTADGQRLSGIDRPNRAEYLERERCCAVAYERLTLAGAALFPLLQPLIEAVEQLRELIDDDEKRLAYRAHRYIEKNNATVAEELFCNACALYFECELIYCGSVGHDAIDEMYMERPSHQRHFISHASAGYGGTRPAEIPAPPYMTRAEADEAGEYWRRIGDTIGAFATTWDVNDLL
jgi:hypothetical protein